MPLPSPPLSELAAGQSVIGRRIAIVGGGISGLAAAHRLREIAQACQVVVFEASARLGGVIRTDRHDGYVIERSADSFITNVPWAVDLCRRIGLADQLTPTGPQRQAYVVCRGRLERVPEGFVLLTPGRWRSIFSTPILSWRGKLRLACEYFVSSRPRGEESLAAFARRRLGREAFERLVQPLIGGIYTADPEKLSLAATMPRFLEMERQHGSLIRAARRQRRASRQSSTGTNRVGHIDRDGHVSAVDGSSGSAARYDLFVTPRAGLSELIATLAKRLPADSLRLNSPVQSVQRGSSGRWEIRTAAETEAFDGLILAAPAHATALLVQDFDEPLAQELTRIPYAGTAIALLAYRRDQIAHPLDGFGFVVPEIEKRRILAASFSSVKFPNRSPDDQVLIRVFLGGACHEELLKQSDDALLQIARQELAELLGIQGEPLMAELARWPRSMPQYHLGHCELVARIEERTAQHPGLALCGNAYHGVGIPHCIHSGEQAAEQVLKRLQPTRTVAER